MTTAADPPTRTTVLLVEDHADTRFMFAEFLRADFTVFEAGDGVGALEVMAQTRPDVVVTDLALPRMDGFELLARIRADSRFRDVPVIALSGFTGTAHESRALAAGATRVIEKPCLPDALAEAVGLAARSRQEGR